MGRSGMKNGRMYDAMGVVTLFIGAVIVGFVLWVILT
jgi:hypothetical protein